MRKYFGNFDRRWTLHFYRVGIFVFLLFAIRQQHSWYFVQRAGEMKQLTPVEDVIPFYPKADSLSDWDTAHGGQNVFDAEGRKLGHIIQTSPDADEIYGFSGPTNTLIAFDAKKQILGIDILRSDDTKEHLSEVKRDTLFLQQWNGLDRDEVLAQRGIHAVSGATLTSDAIADGIARRLGGGGRTSRFPQEVTIDEVVIFLETAAALAPVEKRPFLQQVLDGTFR